MRQLIIMLGVTAVLGCDNSRNVNVSNQNPLGVVGGQVLDVDGEMPLASATVTLQTAGTTLMATTDANGLFAIPKVPVGSFFVTVAATGYQSAYFGATLAGSVGNFPVSNPSMTLPTTDLFKTNNSFAVRLVDDHGAPVSGVAITGRVQVRYFSYGYSNGVQNALSPQGSYAVKATTDMSGLATLSGLPVNYALNLIPVNNYSILGEVNVDVPPVTVMGTQQYQFAGATYPLSPSHLGKYDPYTGLTSPIPVVTFPLAGPASTLSIIASSIEWLDGRQAGAPVSFNSPVGSILPVDKPIAITFSEAVNPSTLRAQVLDENGQPTAITLTPTVDTNLVSLAPSPNFAAGKRYNLALHANTLLTPGTGASSTRELNITAPFFTAGGANVSVTSATNAAGIVTIVFSEPVGPGFGAMTPLPCVAWYDAIDLDGTPGADYQGEFGSPLPACPSTTPPTVIDVTRLTSQEPATATTLYTGFSSKWQVQIFDAVLANGCKTNTATCTKPATGTMMHLLFSHLSGANTFKRADGRPVGDLMAAIQ